MLLTLIRHAEINGDPFCRPARPVSGCLSARGVQQASAGAALLKNVRYDRVFSSPYGRALQTAEILFADRGIPFDIVPALHEWLPAPEAEQVDAIPGTPERHAEETWKTPAGEGCFDMYARIVPAFLAAWAAAGVHPRHGGYVPVTGAEDLNVAVVAHGGSLNVLLSFLLRVHPFPVGSFNFCHVGMAHLRFSPTREVYHPRLLLGAVPPELPA